MFSTSYAETMDEICADDRANEVAAFEAVLDKLAAAHTVGPASAAAVDALFYTNRLWVFLLESLADERNALPANMRANLISIGIWVLKEIERLRQGEVSSLADLIQINTMIRDGLANTTGTAEGGAIEVGDEETRELVHEDRA